eukprot:6489579-Amphidinium_carterae.1
MGARRRLLKELLSNVKYIKNLSEQQIKASLWNGEASLYDLELEPKALNELFHDGLPGGFEILSVTVKELHICIPWNRILTNSTRIVAHDVEVRVSVHCEDEAQWRALFAARQRAFLRKHQERAQSGPYSLAPGASGTFDSLKQRIVDGMQVQVSRASTIVVSSHPRHFPFHGEQPQEQLQSLVEVLRVDGEERAHCDLRPSTLKNKTQTKGTNMFQTAFHTFMLFVEVCHSISGLEADVIVPRTS